jgi:hypothetical protein
LLGFGHRTPENHIVNFIRLNAWSPPQRFTNRDSGKIVRARAAERAVRCLADRRTSGGDDNGVRHKTPSL